MKKIFLIENIWENHHPTYFKIISNVLLELNREIMVLCPNPSELKVDF